MNWQKDKLTIIGFGIIFVILAVFGYLLWDMNKEPMAEVVTEPTTITPKIEPETDSQGVPVKEEKSKVTIYTEEVKIDENGDNWDVKILLTINDSNPELLTTLELRDALVGQFVPYNIGLSPDRKNILLSYYTKGSDILQLFNIETKEIKDILESKKGYNISYPVFSLNSKEIFFLQDIDTNNSNDRIYDFYLYNIDSQKSEIIKTLTTRSGIFNPRWLPENKILLGYSLETTRENPFFRQEFYLFNKDNKTISASSNQKFSLLSEGNQDIFNSDNTLFANPNTFTKKRFKPCFSFDGDDGIGLPNSYTIIETLSGKEIASFKGNPEEPITPISFSPDNKEILYRLDDSGCAVSVDNSKVKYYIQSLNDNQPRQEVNLDDIIKKWDIIFNVPSFGSREIIFYQ
jgi:hypothetical protein